MTGSCQRQDHIREAAEERTRQDMLVRYIHGGRGSSSSGMGQLLGLSAKPQVLVFNLFLSGASKGWKDQTQHAQPTGQGKKLLVLLWQ